jgi:hypothetical protein
MQSNRLGSHHVVSTRTVKRGPGTEHQRADAVGVTETEDTKT